MPIDLLLFGVIAVYLLFRYKNVLGQPPDQDSMPRNTPRDHSPLGEPREDAQEKVVPLRPAPAEMPEIDPTTSTEPLSLASKLSFLGRRLPGFSEKSFLGNANKAFELVVDAYAKGDKEQLETLVAKPVYESFAKAIDDREANKQTLEFELQRITQSQIIDCHLDKTAAKVMVEFRSEQVSVLRDAEGTVIDGDAEHYEEHCDTWTFARSLSTNDPTWFLEATHSKEV